MQPIVSPLHGIRVLDFTHVLAGPFCTRLLADLGADVVRVESDKHPDYPWPSRYRHSDGRHASYMNTNRSKRSVAIDLKKERGREVARRLARVADVVTENFSAGVMTRLELDFGTLNRSNSRLVYASMSGYGHDGPRRDWTSMNMNLQGYGGLMLVNGSEDDPPIAISNSWNDYIGGLHAGFAIIEALAERDRTGVGVNLDLSQFECSVAMIAPLLLSAAVNGKTPARIGNRSTRYAPQGVYRCADQDRWCAISVQNDEQWRELSAAMDSPGWGTEPRFATTLGRMRHHDELDVAIEKWTSRLQDSEVESRLQQRGVPAQRMYRIRDVIEAPDRSHAFRPMEDARIGTMLTTALPLSMSSSPLPPPGPAPRMGQHTEEVLREWLGLSEPEVSRLVDEGIFA